MKKVYKDGNVAICNKEQLDIMLKAGWSLEAPSSEVDESTEKVTEEKYEEAPVETPKSAAKKRVRKPAIAK